MIRWLAVLVLGIAGAAQANCGAVIEALERSMKQERLAQYDIDSPDQPLTGRPMVVRINKMSWIDTGTGQYEKHPDSGANPIISALKRDAAKGAAKCEAIGAGNHRGQASDKYRLDGSVGSSLTGRVTLWISKANGLPIYQEFEKLGAGGIAWVYGSAVKEPR